MNCKNCNAVMRADQEKKIFICPYCDSVEPFQDFSHQELKEELKGIVSEAIRDASKDSGGQTEGRGKKIKSGARKVKDGMITVMQIIFCFFLAFFSVTVFTEEFRVAGFISLAQLILLIVTLVSKSRYRRTGEEKARKRAKISVIAASLLIIAWFGALMMEGTGAGSGSGSGKWPEAGFGSQLPQLPGKLEYSYSGNESFSAYSKGNSASDFVSYISDCKKLGFSIDAEESENSYLAYDEEDNKLKIRYNEYSERLDVSLEKGIVMTDFQWSTQGVSGEIPEPKAEKSYLKTLRNDGYARLEVYVGDLTREEFMNYVNQCMEEGFEGRVEGNQFRGKKEQSAAAGQTDGKKTYLHLNADFQRGRILYLEVYVSDY